jgi:phospholipase C
MASKSPIEHIVLIIKENHGFDNYFGTFPGANGATLAHAPNPPKHDHGHRHADWLKRKTMAAKEQYLEQDIPAYFAYARQFTLCDNYFTDVAGPSTPNHLMLIAGDSPIIDNPARTPPAMYDLPSLPIDLEKAKLTWGNYGGYAFGMVKALQGKKAMASKSLNIANFSFGNPELGETTTPLAAKSLSTQFATDAAAGKLPAVSWVYAPHDASEHPPGFADHDPLVGNVTHGMQLMPSSREDCGPRPPSSSRGTIGVAG